MWRKAKIATLQRQGSRYWNGLAFRFALACLLVALAFSLLWFDRGGLRDDMDGHLSFADVVYFTMITVSTVGFPIRWDAIGPKASASGMISNVIQKLRAAAI